MARPEKTTPAADTKPAETKLTAAGRFTKDRLQADLGNLSQQVAQAEQQLSRAQAQVEQWKGKLQAVIGAHSYCTELLKAYGVEANLPPAPHERKKTAKLKAVPSSQEAPKVE